MKIEGKDGVLTHYLMDVDNRLDDDTLVSYIHRLDVLVTLLRDLFGVTEIEQVTVLHLRQCVQHLLTVPVKVVKRRPESENGVLSVNTVKGYMRVWKAFFNWCYQEELIPTNPVSRLKSPKAPKKVTPAFTEDHIQRMLAACDTSKPVGFRDYVILLLLLDTGMRVAEIGSLRVENVHDTYIKVEGKGRKEREIGIHPEMSKLLWKYIHKYRRAPEGEPLLFMGRSGPLGVYGIQYVIKTIKKKTGLENIRVSAHVFRHTHSKMYMENGGDLFKLSRELGHSSVQVTKIYLEDFGSTEARKEHNSYTPLSFMHLKKNQRRRARGSEK